MSMDYCREHDVHFDTDMVENCPVCCEECEWPGGEQPCIDKACPRNKPTFSKEVPAYAAVKSNELTADEEDFISEPEHHR